MSAIHLHPFRYNVTISKHCDCLIGLPAKWNLSARSFCLYMMGGGGAIECSINLQHDKGKCEKKDIKNMTQLVGILLSL